MKKQWFHMLLVLAEAPCHGAEVQRRVSEATAGAVRLYPVTLYRSLDDLAAEGLIREAEDPEPEQHNERRRFYEITREGRRALAAEADALQAAARMAHAVLNTRGA
jgi:DNA-binding PadR family transcriptional regulator